MYVCIISIYKICVIMQWWASLRWFFMEKWRFHGSLPQHSIFLLLEYHLYYRDKSTWLFLKWFDTCNVEKRWKPWIEKRVNLEKRGKMIVSGLLGSSISNCPENQQICWLYLQYMPLHDLIPHSKHPIPKMENAKSRHSLRPNMSLNLPYSGLKQPDQ